MEQTNNGAMDVQAALKEIVEYVHHLADEIAEIKVSIMDELIGPIQNEYNKMQYENALSDFRCKYAEKLEPFGDKLKSIEGDDFDVVKKTFDDFLEDNKGYEEVEYVDEKAKLISDQLDKIGKAFGIEPEKIEEVKIETENGEVKAEVEDGEVTTVEGETETTEEVETEEPIIEGEKVETEEEETPAIEEEKEPEVEEKKESISDKIKRITH